MGSSYCLHSPLHHLLSPPPSTSSSSLPLSSRPLFLYLQNSERKRRNGRLCRVPMASLQPQKITQDIDFCKRRALLILGISVFPLLPWNNEAFASEDEDTSGENKKTEKPPPSGNPFLSLLNAIGILSSGVLAALYNLARKDKAASDATIESDLTATSKNCESLQKELVETYKLAESAKNDLKEEKKMVASLNNEIQSLEEQIVQDKELRISLETSLKEATRSLDEMNQQALVLSKDLEVSNSRVSSLEEEKAFLNGLLEKEKKLAQDARENLEDAQSVIMKLGTERENLQKKSKKLEDDLAMTKGEILRLRAEIISSRSATNSKPKQEKALVTNGEAKEVTETETKTETETVDNQPKQEAEPAVETTAASTKRTTRKKKTSSQ